MSAKSLIGDRYEILEPIGQGVSAVVYEAIDHQSDRHVAVKLLSPHLRADEISIERFRREVQITRHLDHPQIVSIYDFGQDESNDEQIWLAMELLEGSNLKDYMAIERPLAVENALTILRQLLTVLASCHAKNVIHRDLKPQNIFIDDQSRIKLLDFGISRMTTLRDITQTGTSLGSPEYMAPELFATSVYDPRTDLYAVGVIAFELFAGHLPYQGDSLPVLYQAHLEQEPASLRDQRDDVPEWLQHWIERLLAKRAHERYQSAEEALLDLEAGCVAVRRLPETVQRRCLVCEAATRDDLPLCGSCGADPDALLGGGDCALHCSRDVDVESLAQFVEEVLGAQLTPPKRGRTLLLDGLDRAAAERIKAIATRRGLYVEMRERHRSPRTSQRIGRALGTLFAGWVVAPVVLSLVTGAIGVFLYGLGAAWGLLAWTVVQFVAGGAGLLSIVGAPFWIADRWRKADPLVVASDSGRQRVIGDVDWLVELAPRLKELPAGSARIAVSGLVDKFARVAEASSRFGSANVDRLHQLLDRAVDLAGLISRIGGALDEGELAVLGQRFTALEAEAARQSDIESWNGREELKLAEESLRALSALDDHRGLLENQLTAVQAVFARVIAQVLVFDHALDASDLELLDSSLERVETDLSLSREIAKELEDL